MTAYDGLGGMLKERIWLIALLLLSAWSTAAAEHVTYFHNDGLGSPVAGTNDQGEVLWTEAYDPYGIRLVRPIAANRLWYTGKSEESDLGLTYFGARWYEPGIGRFHGIDPKEVEPGDIYSFNRYAYANDNPYTFLDPDGNKSLLLFVAALEYNRDSPKGGAYFAVNVTDSGIHLGYGTNWVTRGVSERNQENGTSGGNEVAIRAGTYRLVVENKKSLGPVPALENGSKIPTLKPNEVQKNASVADGILIHGMNRWPVTNDPDHGGANYYGSEGCHGPANGYAPIPFMEGSESGDTGTYRLYRPREWIDDLRRLGGGS